MDSNISAYLRKTLPSGKIIDKEHVVYWLYDDSCLEYAGGPALYGYVGVAMRDRFHSRILEHRRSKRFPNGFKVKIISDGLAETCYIFENVLRPKSNIGWNIAPGGARGKLLGITKNPETKIKISLANTGNKRPDLSLRNSMQKGNPKHRICPHCGKEGRGPTMFRYHFNNCKNLKRKDENEI